MNETTIDNYGTVCAAPGGTGFRILHMPEFLMSSDIDDCSPHVHSFYEILWFQKGEGTHTVDFVNYEVRPGTLFFLAPGQIHHFDALVDKTSGKCGYRGIAIQMCTDFISDKECGSNAMIKYNAFYTFDTAPYYHIDKETSDELDCLVREMEDESRHAREFGNIDILKSLLRIFLVKVQRQGRQDTLLRLDSMRPAHQLFILFRKMVEQEYRHLHSVQEYADRLNVAVRTLNKCVNECSGRSPLSFINTRIILEGKRMVRYTNMMIKEIAFELGFKDPSYFVKLFKRETGHLPSEFREIDNVTSQFIIPPKTHQKNE